MWATGVTFGYLLQQCESKLPRTCGHTTEDLTLEEAQDYCKRVRYVVTFFALYQWIMKRKTQIISACNWSSRSAFFSPVWRGEKAQCGSGDRTFLLWLLTETECQGTNHNETTSLIISQDISIFIVVKVEESDVRLLSLMKWCLPKFLFFWTLSYRTRRSSTHSCSNNGECQVLICVRSL